MRIFLVPPALIFNGRKIKSAHSKHLNLFNTQIRTPIFFHSKYYKVTSTEIYPSRSTKFMSPSNKFTEIYYSSKSELLFPPEIWK